MASTRLEKVARMLSKYFHDGERFYQSYCDEITTDWDYFDGDQMTLDEKDELESRDQPVIQFNEIQSKVGAITGTEERTKLDIAYKPRGGNDSKKSSIFQAASKYVEDENGSDFETSEMFASGAIGGFGAMFCGFGWDPEGPRVVEESVDWRDLRIDPCSKRYSYDDARFIIRKSWMDVEAAVAMFPSHAKQIRESVGRAGGNPDRPLMDYTLSGVNEEEREWHEIGTNFGWRSDEWLDGQSERVMICECYYRVYETRDLLIRVLTQETSEIKLDDPTEEQVMIMATEPHSIRRGVPVKRVRVAFFAGPNILLDEPSPYAHNRFPFALMFAFRKKRTGAPYGVVRGMRDAQDIVNVSFSKMMYALGTTQVFFETGAFMDAEKAAQQVNDPGAQVELTPGGIKKIMVHRWEQNAMMHKTIMDMAGLLLGENSGATEAFMGQKSNETSGYAIEKRQNASAVTLAGLFKNYRKTMKTLAELRISCIQQAFTGPMFLEITDDPEAPAIVANDLLYIPEEGKYMPQNTITHGRVDVVIASEQHSDSVRQMFAEQLMQLISRLPDEYVAALIHIPIELADPPKKEQILAGIKQVQGMMGIATSTPGGGNNGGGTPQLAPPPSPNQPRVAAGVGR